MDPYRQDIRFILCGHVHSFFEDELDGYKIAVSGGAGARLEFFGGLPDKDHSFHHVLQFSFDDQGLLQYQYVSLANVAYEREVFHDKVRLILEKGFEFEASAHTRYQFFAEDAYEKGFPGIARLFRAYARSAYYHARNYFSVLNKMRGITENLGDSLALENSELDVLMARYMPSSHEGVTPLAYYAFYEAYEAKKKNIELLPAAIGAYAAGEDIGTQSYYVCTTCGNMRSADEPPDHCHICGAPPDKIIKIE
jgi:rubrerythrin